MLKVNGADKNAANFEVKVSNCNDMFNLFGERESKIKIVELQKEMFVLKLQLAYYKNNTQLDNATRLSIDSKVNNCSPSTMLSI